MTYTKEDLQYYKKQLQKVLKKEYEKYLEYLRKYYEEQTETKLELKK